VTGASEDAYLYIENTCIFFIWAQSITQSLLLQYYTHLYACAFCCCCCWFTLHIITSHHRNWALSTRIAPRVNPSFLSCFFRWRERAKTSTWSPRRNSPSVLTTTASGSHLPSCLSGACYSLHAPPSETPRAPLYLSFLFVYLCMIITSLSTHLRGEWLAPAQLPIRCVVFSHSLGIPPSESPFHSLHNSYLILFSPLSVSANLRNSLRRVTRPTAHPVGVIYSFTSIPHSENPSNSL